MNTIEYILLLLILILIGFIVFIIYLSYEYRLKDGKDDKNQEKIKNDKKIESFVLETINPSIKKFDISNDSKNFINNYKKYISNSINDQMNKDNITNVGLLKNANLNLASSKALLDLKNNIDPKPVAYPIDKVIKTIKSNYNAQYLSTFAKDSSSYGVLVNDKCFTVNGLCKDEFCTLDCKNGMFSSDSQKFTTKRIYSDADAGKVMNTSVNKISSTNVYPFNIFKSSVNDKCLSINNEGLSVETCNLNNINQQWSISPDENICVLN